MASSSKTINGSRVNVQLNIWSLFACFMLLTALDTAISLVMLRMGGAELNPVYRLVSGNVAVFIGFKVTASFIAGLVLVNLRKVTWLMALNIGLVLICLVPFVYLLIQ
jgi:hypothetical protein